MSVELIIELNRKYSQEFGRPDKVNERLRFRREFPTEVGSTCCMDGRGGFNNKTRTTCGIYQPENRSLGGQFDLGDYGFSGAIAEWYGFASSQKRDCLLCATYHYSESNPSLGCAGYGYDTAAAASGVKRLKSQFDEAYGTTDFYTVTCGIETDSGAFVFHSERGVLVDVRDLQELTHGEVEREMKPLFPGMKDQIRHDFARIVTGNADHVKWVAAHSRSNQHFPHREFGIGIGRGLDWAYDHNFLLTVSPFGFRSAEAVEIAGKVLLDNVKSGRTDHKPVLLASAQYRWPGTQKIVAGFRAKHFRDFALGVLRKKVPELVPMLQVLTARVNMQDRLMEVPERGE